METFIAELSRVDRKQMAIEKRGTLIAKLSSEIACMKGDDIVSSAWKHAAVYRKTVKSLRLLTKITDEGGTHLNLFVKMYETLQEENPEIFDDQFKRDAIELIKSAVDLETIWGKHIISGGVLGLTDTIVENRIKYLADLRANAIGLGIIYGVKNPIPWVDKFSKIDGEDANFFEDKVSSYSIGTLEW